MHEKYTVTNRFHTLIEIDETATHRYERFIETNKETAKEVLPEKRLVRKHKDCSDTRVTPSRKSIEGAYRPCQQCPDSANNNALRQKLQGTIQV